MHETMDGDEKNEQSLQGLDLPQFISIDTELEETSHRVPPNESDSGFCFISVSNE